jgi:cytochrome P450
MLLQDPPTHTRLRKLVSKAFTPRAIESWRPRVQAITGELLDRVAKRGSMDLAADLALPVPATLICELLGIPPQDQGRFTQWTADATHGLLTVRGLGGEEMRARVDKAGMSLAAYFTDLIERRRGNPGNDLLAR